MVRKIPLKMIHYIILIISNLNCIYSSSNFAVNGYTELNFVELFLRHAFIIITNNHNNTNFLICIHNIYTIYIIRRRIIYEYTILIKIKYYIYNS